MVGLLERNVKVGTMVGGGLAAPNYPSTFDPLSEDFAIPTWEEKSPQSLIGYYRIYLGRRLRKNGQTWRPPLGYENGIYFRAAKSLLDKYSWDIAIRIVTLAIDQARGPLSLQRIDTESGDYYRCIPNRLIPKNLNETSISPLLSPNLFP